MKQSLLTLVLHGGAFRNWPLISAASLSLPYRVTFHNCGINCLFWTPDVNTWGFRGVGMGCMGGISRVYWHFSVWISVYFEVTDMDMQKYIYLCFVCICLRMCVGCERLFSQISLIRCTKIYAEAVREACSNISYVFSLQKITE